MSFLGKVGLSVVITAAAGYLLLRGIEEYFKTINFTAAWYMYIIIALASIPVCKKMGLI